MADLVVRWSFSPVVDDDVPVAAAALAWRDPVIPRVLRMSPLSPVCVRLEGALWPTLEDMVVLHACVGSGRVVE